MDTADAIWFADNNAKRQGTTVLGLSVIAPAEIPATDVDLIIVGSMSRDPIRKQFARARHCGRRDSDAECDGAAP